MKAYLAAAALLPAPALADGAPWAFGVVGGIEPSPPLHTEYMVGGFLDVPLAGRWSLELDGTWRQGLSTSSDLFAFMRDQDLIDPDDPIADRTVWTADAAARFQLLEGKLALLHLPAGGFAASLGAGGGARASDSRAGESSLAPVGFAVLGLDLLFGDVTFARLDARGFGTRRRDDTIGLGAELRLGFGVRL